MDLVALCRYIWLRRYFVCKVAVAGVILGVIIALSIPKEYSTKVQLLPYASKNDRADKNASFASMLGLTVNNSSLEDIALDFYPVVVKSTPFLVDLAQMKVVPNGLSEMSLFEYITQEQKKPWRNSMLKLFGKLFFSTRLESDENSNLNWDPFYYTYWQEMYLDVMNDKIEVWVEKKSGLVNIEVDMQDPLVAALIADSTINKLQTYVSSIQKAKMLNDMGYAEKMYNQAKYNYEVAKDRQGTISRGQIELEMSLNLCNMLARQYEMLQAKVTEERTLFSIIEPAKVALNADKPNRKVIVFVFTFLFIFSGIIWLILKRVFARD